jgi:DNA modification methylase
VTDQDDRVIDIFSGSNTTGQVAEGEKRRWMSFEQLPEYVATSAFRFLDKGANADVMRAVHARILEGESVEIERYGQQSVLEL